MGRILEVSGQVEDQSALPSGSNTSTHRVGDFWDPEFGYFGEEKRSLPLLGSKGIKRAGGDLREMGPKSVSKQPKVIIWATGIYYLFIFYFKTLSVTLSIAHVRMIIKNRGCGRELSLCLRHCPKVYYVNDDNLQKPHGFWLSGQDSNPTPLVGKKET